MNKLDMTTNVRTVRDPQNQAVRSWFHAAAHALSKSTLPPKELARQVLADNAGLFQWKVDLPDLEDVRVLETVNARSVRLRQDFKGVPVDASEVVVNMTADGRVHSIYNHYHYAIPNDLDPKEVKVNEKAALKLVQGLLSKSKGAQVISHGMVVYRYAPAENHPPKASRNVADREKLLAALPRAEGAAGETGRYFLVWDFTANTKNPAGSWRILVDANSGALVNVLDLLQYATGTSQVFDPNPIVTSGVAGLSSTSTVATLDAQRSAVPLDRLDPAGGGLLRLDGSFVKMDEIESPNHAEPTSATGDFSFSSSNRDFLAAMVYYHIDRFQHYIQTDLGLTNVANFAISVDPQGLSGADNSHYVPSTKILAFGEGGIPDAADADVILHEYGHAIQDNSNPGFSNYSAGISEGFGDTVAAIYHDNKHANPSVSRGIMMAWDANPTDAFWPGRRYDVDWLFDGPEFASANGHLRGQLWCATMFELYRKLGGDSGYDGLKRAARDLALRLHLIANFAVPTTGATATSMGQQIEVADSNLGGWRYADGLHKKVIYDTFRRRHLSGYPDLGVDVYVDDGRGGGYGSASGNDAFNENLWDEVFWNTQDLWVTTSPYASAAAQAAGSSADHVEPPVGSTAYLYVRVKNRGTNAGGSGPVTVKAFHCEPGMGLTWPDNWTPMDVPSASVANVLPGAANGVVLGPFEWVPTEVGHECLLAIVESDSDRAITQDLLPSDHVPHAHLVPFDNNIAQRNIAPTPAKGSKVRGFWVTNPFSEVKTVKLDFASTLPKGWTFRTDLAANQFRLGPLERRWVNLTIDQAGGQEVTRFDGSSLLQITGLIDEQPIGGMSFYVAPARAFGRPSPSGKPVDSACVKDMCCFSIPWDECELEGELELKVRFRRR